MYTSRRKAILVLASITVLAAGLCAQPPAAPGASGAAGRGRGGGRGGPVVISPQIESDGKVTFRVYAPQATAVTVGGDISGGLVPAGDATPAGAPAVPMTKGVDGVWSGTTVRAVKAGAWRYNFTVDGVTTVDARNVLASQPQPDSGSESSCGAG